MNVDGCKTVEDNPWTRSRRVDEENKVYVRVYVCVCVY